MYLAGRAWKWFPASDLIGTGSKQIPLFQVDVGQVATFACANADMTGRLRPILMKELRQQGDLWDLFEKVELPLAPVLAYMERCGVSLDTTLLKRDVYPVGEQLAEIEKKVYAEADRNLTSTRPYSLE